MRRFLVIENEPKQSDLIQEAIKTIDAGAEIVLFNNYQEFEKKLADLQDVEKIEFLKFNLSLVSLADRPTREWKGIVEELKKMIPQNPLPASICLTSYENKAIPLSFLKSLEVFNVIYKPFDPLILKENINLSMQSGKLALPLEIKSQKSSAFIAVLKEVELESISELGFLTISDAAIPLTSLTKYFSSLFNTGRKQSVWAQCLVSMAHPKKPGFFINKFQFYHVKKDFLNLIRKYVTTHKLQETSSAFWNLSVESRRMDLRMAIIGEKNQHTQAYERELQAYFTNVQVDFLDLSQFDTWDKSLDHEMIINMSDIDFDKFKSYFKEGTRFFWMPSAEPREDQLKDHAANYRDIFSPPIDRSYFFKKLKSHFPDLMTAEAPYLLNVTCHEIIKAANTIKVNEVSEVFINFNYSRELDVSTFREFIFLTPKDEQAIEIPAFCHFKEKAKNLVSGDNNIYFHQFIFFGMTDFFQKEIRLWLLHNYISSNQKDQ